MVDLAGRHVAAGSEELFHAYRLADGYVIQDAEKTDHDTSEEQPYHVDGSTGTEVERYVFVARVARKLRCLYCPVGTDSGHYDGCDHADDGCRRRFIKPVRDV